MSDIKPGDYVRVQYEGEVQHVDGDGCSIRVFGRWPVHVDAVTKIEQPVPDDAIGACDSGYFVQRQGDAWAHDDGSFCPGPVKIHGRKS